MIDPAKAVPQLIPLLTSRPDWTAARVASVLQTAGADVISDPIATAAIAFSREDTTTAADQRGRPINQAARLVRYLELSSQQLGASSRATPSPSHRMTRRSWLPVCGCLTAQKI